MPRAVSAPQAPAHGHARPARARWASTARSARWSAGKSADFIAVDLRRPATQPVYNVLSQLVYAAGRDQVSDVFVAGRALMRDRALLDASTSARRSIAKARTELARARIDGA